MALSLNRLLRVRLPLRMFKLLPTYKFVEIMAAEMTSLAVVLFIRLLVVELQVIFTRFAPERVSPRGRLTVIINCNLRNAWKTFVS